ncbi:MAG TPA: sensor histidine kinase [Gemmatimonadaceae bacterium]
MYFPRWVAALLRVPLIGKIAGANALIVTAAVLVSHFSGMVGQDSRLWLLLLASLGLGLIVNAILVLIALRPLKDLEHTARSVWQGELDARVPASPVADAGIQRVGNTLNVLLDGLMADRVKLRTLANQIIRTGDQERASIARELHDSTAQSLAALLLELSVLASENTEPLLDARITRIRTIVSDVLDEVRLVAHTVHPRVLDDLGLAAALQLLARETQERSGVTVTCAGPANLRSMDPASASTLYRVSQEAVGNAIRHAQATRVSIGIAQRNETVELEVIDDGIGFNTVDAERQRPGMGLFTMRERAALVGGRLTLQSVPGSGTRVLVTVPMTAAAPARALRPAIGIEGTHRSDREEM